MIAGALPAHQKRKLAIIFSCPNTADHSYQEGQIFTVVTYHRYMRRGGELEDKIDVIGGGEGGVYASVKRHRERYDLISGYPIVRCVVVRSKASAPYPLGDMVTFVRDGKTYGAVFCLDEKDGLTMWDLGSKGQVSYESVLKNDITGFYKQETPGFFKLDTNYSDSKLPSEYNLGWNWSGGYGEYVKHSIVHSQLTAFEYACFTIGTVALVEGFGPIGIASYALSITPLVFSGEDIYQIQSYQSTYPGMPAPLAGPNEPMGTPIPPTRLNP